MTIVIYFVFILCRVLTFAIIIRAILSWFPLSSNNPFAIILYQITEPILAPLRRIIPRIGMFDITPIIAIILLQIISRLLSSALS